VGKECMKKEGVKFRKFYVKIEEAPRLLSRHYNALQCMEVLKIRCSKARQ
jgi:hypothetical protein